MIKKYNFLGVGSLEFDDNNTVAELIDYAFNKFEYFEPYGMDVVTLFQCHHPETSTGWFTTDTSKRCVDEIINHNQLCFAYYWPNVFYFAEGGWGHHMKELGNHPYIPNSVELKLRFVDFYNTIIVNGNYTFKDVVKSLKAHDYVNLNCNRVRVSLVGCGKQYIIYMDDPIIEKKLVEFQDEIKKYHVKYGGVQDGDCVYHEIFDLD